jgi:hypothetical protein
MKFLGKDCKFVKRNLWAGLKKCEFVVVYIYRGREKKRKKKNIESFEIKER